MLTNTKALVDTILGFGRPNKPTNSGVVYRDELKKKKQHPPPNKLKKGDWLETQVPLLACKDEEWEKTSSNLSEDKKGVIRVKVKMTKEEAARLMSKCKDGGVLEFRDVANELAQIPINRVSVVSSSDNSYCSMLKTIPEEVCS